MNFSGKTAVITGATSGIGLELTMLMLRAGAKTFCIGRDFTRLETALSIQKTDVAEAVFISADFTKTSDLELLVEKLNGESSIDILVHSAGVISLGNIEDESLESLNLQYQVNVSAPFYITGQLLPRLKKTKGQIVFVNSTTGLDSWEGVGTYAASKHALRALAVSLRKELAGEKVRVTNVYLGSVDTPMQEKVQKLRGNPYRPEKFMSAAGVASVIFSVLQTPREVTVTDITLRRNY